MSDITIADYWGIDKVNPDFDDDKGTSLVLISSEKGMLYFSKIKCLKIETSYEDCFYRNKAIEYSAKENVNSNLFWRYFNSNGFENIQEYIESLLKPTMIEIIKRKFSTMLRLLKLN